MDYRLQDLIDIPLFQALQDRLDQIYSFPAAIIDNDGNVLTATAWQDICTRFHRVHPECSRECRASDLYIMNHLAEANPAVTYRCPHGLVDNATPIVIGGRHLGNYFTGQFFLEPPDLDFFRQQATRYGFDEAAYLAAVAKVPVWSEAKLHQYVEFIKGFVEILAGIGLRQLQTREAQRLLATQGSDPGSAGLMAQQIIDSADEGVVVYGPDLHYRVWNPYMERMTGVPASAVIGRHPVKVFPFLAHSGVVDRVARALQGQRLPALEFAFDLPTGKAGWCVDNTVPLFAENGAIVGALGSVVETTERRRIKAELQARETELRDLVESSSDRVWAIDGRGRHTFVNAAVRDLLGYEPADLIGQPAFALMHPDDAPRWQLQIAEWARLGQGWRHQRMRWVHGNGETRTFESSANPIFGIDGQVTGFRGIDRDITEQLQAQSDYEGLFTEMLDGFAVHEIICNEAGQPVDYRFLAVNPAFERLTGLTAGAVVGRTAREVLPGLESEWVESYGRVALTGQPAHFEQRATSLGKVFEVRAFCPRPGRFACVFVDTTARVEAETRRRESEARQQAMLAALPDLLFRLDRNGVIRSYKANLDDLYTPPELELVGRRQQDLLPPAIATLIEERAAAALTSGALQTFDYVLDVRGRGPRSYEARMVRSGEDEVTTVVRDVTEREEQDRQRRVDLAIQYVRAEILAMGDARDWAQVIAAVDRQLRTVLRFDHCSVALIDPAADRVQLYWVSPDGRVREQERQQIHPALRQVWADQQPLQRYRDVDPRFGADMPPEVQAVVDVPFAAGTLAVNTRDPDGFTGPQIGLLVRFAAVLGEAAQRLADLRQQQRMAHALAESEELHRRLVEVSPTAIFIHVNGIIVFVNPAGLALLGAQQEGDLLGRQVLDFVHPDYRARVTARAQHALRANLPIPLAEEQLVRLDGRVIDAEVTGNSLVYHGQPAIQVIAYDITERRRAGVALAASERRYQLLFERSHDAIFLVDPRTGRYLHANQAATTLTGRSLEEIRQLTTNQLCPRGAQDRLRRLARAAGAMDMEEVEYLRPDGTRRTALLTAVPIDDSVSFGIAHDITARKRIESETLLSLALQRLRSEVLQMSRPDDWGRVVTATGRELAAVFALAGYRVTLLQDPQSNLHRYWVSVAGQVALRVTDRWPAAVREAVNSGQAVQVTAPTVDDLGDGIDAEAGRVITVPFVGGVLEVGQAQADDPGEEGLAVLERVAEVLAQACQRSRDLAEQQRLAAEVERQRLQAVQADRLQALGEMATGVAHELNQPLSGIRAFAEGTLIGLRRQWQLAPDELEHTLSDIIDQVDRITEIVDHMRVFARAQGKPGLFPLEEPIAGAMKLIGAQLRSHGISVRHELAPDLPPCLGWSHQIEQILLNLLSNARDALDHRGKAHRSLDPANAVGWHGQVVISATQVPAGLRLSVADNGGGIPSDIADRVFEPFFTTKPPGEGTGIGLAIVKSIVDRHGGTLTVDNQPGEGVTFVVTLPAGTRGHEGVAAR